MRRIVRFVLRIGLLLVTAVVVYLAVTFVQVWHAGHDDQRRPAEAIIVLGAAQYNGLPSPVFERRLRHALTLYESDLAKFIVVTGGKRTGDTFTEAQSGYRYLRRNGVPDDALLQEVQGANTWQELAASARFLRNRNIRHVLLVTDDYHALRVGAIADDLGLDASVSPVPSGKSTASEVRALARETFAVGVGRFVGYRRLVDIDDAVTRVRQKRKGG